MDVLQATRCWTEAPDCSAASTCGPAAGAGRALASHGAEGGGVHLPGGSPQKGSNKEILCLFFSGYVFPQKLGLDSTFGVLGPENEDSSSTTTYIVLFPGLNSSKQSFYHYYSCLSDTRKTDFPKTILIEKIVVLVSEGPAKKYKKNSAPDFMLYTG